MSLTQVTVVAPATTANLGPGFDVFGLALKQPHDKFTLNAIRKGIKVDVVGFLAQKVSALPRKNTANTVADLMKREFKLETGIQIRIDRGIMPGVGLGSSAASAAAVACGLNYMFKLKLDKSELVRLAAQGEATSAGYAHADNVSAAIYGGFIIVRSYSPLKVVSFRAPENMEICVAYPQMTTPIHKTKEARSLVPTQVPIEKVVHNVGSAAAIASGFANGDPDLVGAAMSDAVVEPERARLIPGYQNVKENALKAGASGVAISGAGPAMIAIVNKDKANATKVAKAMKKAFETTGLAATAFVSAPGKGVQILETEK